MANTEEDKKKEKDKGVIETFTEYGLGDPDYKEAEPTGEEAETGENTEGSEDDDEEIGKDDTEK